MLFSALLRRLGWGPQVASPARRRPRTSPSARRRSFLPRLEALEDRTVPSTFTVTNLLDDGSAGSLRVAITAANANPGADVIDFAPGLIGTIGLTKGELDITDSLTLTGPGAGSLTVSGNNAGRVFNVAAGTTDAISGLTIANGRTQSALESGAGILNAGTLTLSSCSIRNNYLIGDPAGSSAGGGIANFATLTVVNSTLSGNSAGGNEGGGGIWSSGVLTVTACTLSGNAAEDGGGIKSVRNETTTIQDSTFSANQAVNVGGGIDVFGGQAVLSNCTLFGNTAGAAGGGISSSFGGSPTVINCTISGNSTSGNGGGLASYGGFNQAVFNLRNTIVAGNTAPSRHGPDLACVLVSSGYNLIGNPQGGSGFVATDLLKVNPKLGPLQNNGGPTLTMALLLGSAAIGAGDPNSVGLPAYDARGPGYARVAAGRVDIGAFEVQNTATHFALGVPSKVTAGVPFSVTVTALDAYGRVALGYTGTVMFSSTDPNATLPGVYTFTAADQGIHAFAGLVLPKKGKVAVSVTDSLDPSLFGSVEIQVA